MSRKVVIEIVNDKPRNYYFKDSISDNVISYEKFVEVDEDKIDLTDLDCYKYVNNKLEFDNTLLNTKNNVRKEYLKKNILENLEIAKENALNQEIELDVSISGSNEKVIYVDNRNTRRLFLDNLNLIKILNKDKFKVKVRNSKNTYIFIEVGSELIKKISEEIFNKLEQVELIEQTVLQGLNRYTLEQLEQLNVFEFFES